MAVLNTVEQLKDGISAQLQGLNLDNVRSLSQALERTARQTCIELDIPEASLQQNLVLYDGVYDYAGLDYLFGSAITDIRPQGVTRSPADFTYRQPPQDFDREKRSGTTGFRVTFEFKDGQVVTRIVSATAKPRAVIDSMSLTTGWTAGGSLGSLAQDSFVCYDSPSSLRFTLTGSSTGTLTKTVSSLNLSDYEDVGVAFLAVRLPDGATATDLTSMVLRLGSSASAYDQVTVTEGFLGAWSVGEWLLVAFDMSTATSTGTPDWSAIDYCYISFAHSSTMTNFRIGGLWMSYPSPVTAYYQSNAIFLNGSTRSNRISTVSDSIILNEPAYAIYERKCALTIAEQQGGTLASNFIQKIERELYGIPGDPNRLGLIAMFKADNPSRELREVGYWYD